MTRNMSCVVRGQPWELSRLAVRRRAVPLITGADVVHMLTGILVEARQEAF